MPRVPDLERVGLKAGVHYVDVERVMGNNERLVRMLDNHAGHRHIAESALAWHQAWADRLLFGTYERILREATGERFPARLVE